MTGKLTVDSESGHVTGPAAITYNDPFPCVNGTPGGSGAMAGVVMHTQVGDNPGTVAWFNNPQAQASAFFCVAQDGSVVQMGPVGKDWEAWAEAAGNPSWYSIEFADHENPANALTAAQVTVAAQLVECLSAFAGFPLQLSESPDVKGFGWHGMGGEAWGGHFDCPGDVRKAQRGTILALAESIRAGTHAAAPATAKKKAAPVSSVPIEILNDSVVIHAAVNGKATSFILDTGDAIGPVFTAADAARLGLVQGQPFGVEGAGGSSSAYQTTASISFDDATYADEPSAIDLDLQGDSLLGLPFFLARTSAFTFDLAARTLSLTPTAPKEPT